MKRKGSSSLFALLSSITLTVLVFMYVFGNKSDLLHKNDTGPVNLSVDAKKTIVFSFGGNDFNNNLRTQIGLFMEANPDIEVKILQLPNSTDYQRNSYVSAFKSRDASVDVISADIIWTAEFASNGWVLPLNDYFNEEMQQQFIKSSIEGCRYNGSIYGVPKRSDAPLLYYRKDIVPVPPKTYDELIDRVLEYKDTTGIRYGYVFQGNAYEGMVCNVLEFIWSYGGHVIEDEGVLIRSAESARGLQKLVDIVNNGISSPDVLSFIEDDAMLAFRDGNALFMRNWPYAYAQLLSETSKVKDKTGICGLPAGDPELEQNPGTLGGWNYMINKYSKFPDEAWRLIKWLTGYDMQLLDYRLGGIPPTRIDVYTQLKKEGDTMAGQLEDIVRQARLRPVSPEYAAITESMQKHFSVALNMRSDVQTALENIERDMLNILEKTTLK